VNVKINAIVTSDHKTLIALEFVIFLPYLHISCDTVIRFCVKGQNKQSLWKASTGDAKAMDYGRRSSGQEPGGTKSPSDGNTH
jgi:hypothetical protein